MRCKIALKILPPAIACQRPAPAIQLGPVLSLTAWQGSGTQRYMEEGIGSYCEV